MGAHRQMLWLTPVVAGTEISSTVSLLYQRDWDVDYLVGRNTHKNDVG
jgi:hypothetical protein